MPGSCRVHLQLLPNSNDISHQGGKKAGPKFGVNQRVGLAKPSLPWLGCNDELGWTWPLQRSSTGAAELSFMRHLQHGKDRLGNTWSNNGGLGFNNDTLKKRRVEPEELNLSLHL
ncbi:hypothetical protein Ancab_013251 [Ancistrocladus abbreviatus]